MEEKIKAFREQLSAEEKSRNTILKYIRGVQGFVAFVGGAVTKETVIGYKDHLSQQKYAPKYE